MAQALRKATAFDVARLLFVGSIWGASFIFISLSLESFGPVTVATFRILLAAVVLAIISIVIGQAVPNHRSDWIKVSSVGVLNSAIPFFLISWGQQYISSAEAALLMATGTFFALLFSHFSTTDEKINFARVTGVLVGFCGVAVLVITDLLTEGAGSVKGQIAIMGAGASYAASSVLARRISHLPPISTAAVIMGTACCYMIPLALFVENPLAVRPTAMAVLSILFLGVVATALAFAVRFTIIRDNGAVFMAQVGYLVPLFGVIWSWLFLTSSIAVTTWMSLAFIILGIGIARKGVK